MQVGQGLVTVVAMVALLLRLSWVVGLIVLVAALPSAIVRLRFSGKLYRWQRSTTPADRQSSYLHWLLTDGSHAKEIRLFDLGTYFRDWFRGLRKTLRHERLGITAKRSIADLASAEMARNRAVILISHRFSTVYRADRIYILDKGSVAESGTHAELMELDGVYRRMYEVQARAYQTKAT
jgi:ATP-binding cassette subfamily B protein